MIIKVALCLGWRWGGGILIKILKLLDFTAQESDAQICKLRSIRNSGLKIQIIIIFNIYSILH